MGEVVDFQGHRALAVERSALEMRFRTAYFNYLTESRGLSPRIANLTVERFMVDQHARIVQPFETQVGIPRVWVEMGRSREEFASLASYILNPMLQMMGRYQWEMALNALDLVADLVKAGEGAAKRPPNCDE